MANLNTAESVLDSALAALRKNGWAVREHYILGHGDNFETLDGISATKRVGGVVAEAYMGCDNNEGFIYQPVVYVAGKNYGSAADLIAASKAAEFRAMIESRKAVR